MRSKYSYRKRDDYHLVRSRISDALSGKHDSNGDLIKYEISVGLPRSLWVFIKVYAGMTGQTVDEAVSFFAQEHLGLVIDRSMRSHLKN